MVSGAAAGCVLRQCSTLRHTSCREHARSHFSRYCPHRKPLENIRTCTGFFAHSVGQEYIIVCILPRFADIELLGFPQKLVVSSSLSANCIVYVVMYFSGTLQARSAAHWPRLGEPPSVPGRDTHSNSNGNKSSGALYAPEGWAGWEIANLIHGDRESGS